jgi:hypothetical protein
MMITRWSSTASATTATVHVCPSRTKVSPTSGTRSVTAYSHVPDGNRMVIVSEATGLLSPLDLARCQVGTAGGRAVGSASRVADLVPFEALCSSADDRAPWCRCDAFRLNSPRATATRAPRAALFAPITSAPAPIVRCTSPRACLPSGTREPRTPGRTKTPSGSHPRRPGLVPGARSSPPPAHRHSCTQSTSSRRGSLPVSQRPSPVTRLIRDRDSPHQQLAGLQVILRAD